MCGEWLAWLGPDRIYTGGGCAFHELWSFYLPYGGFCTRTGFGVLSFFLRDSIAGPEISPYSLLARLVLSERGQRTVYMK